MNAIVPIHVAGLRVSNTDQSNVVNNFKGCTAVFDQMPYKTPENRYHNVASIGDHIYLPLEGEGTARNPLGQGVHLHWELPDFFRRGVQPSTGGELSFPHAPNRWLVTRYFSKYDAGQYGPVQTKSWIVESDFLSAERVRDADNFIRPQVTVPLPANPRLNDQPFLFMGRVLDYALGDKQWNPASEKPAQYLPAQTGADGKLLYLTAMGFTGPSFCAYYPECCSVFGFWDRFNDLAVFDAINNNNNNKPVRFKVSYQVIGWINEAASDPLAGLNQVITDAYNAMLAQCRSQGLSPTQTPVDVFDVYMRQHYRWFVNKRDISYTLDNQHNLTSLTVPGQTLCAGSLQEIVWDLDENAMQHGFLANSDPDGEPFLWIDKEVAVAVGNTTTEALSVLLKKELNNAGNDPDLLNNFEYLLDAFQLGLLNGLENDPHPIFQLDDQLHTRAFSRSPGGQLWIVQQGPTGAGTPPNPDREITLPLDVAEKLNLLNTAQKNYDQDRARVLAMRQQLFMDWRHYIRLYMGEISADDDNVSVNKLIDFLSVLDSDQCEIGAVLKAGKETGVLVYTQDRNTGRITGLGQEPVNSASRAHAVWASFHALHRALPVGSGWTVQCVPSPPFWTPTDPVLLMEGKRIETLRRSATGDTLFVRLSGELLGNLKLTCNGAPWSVAAASLAGLPALNAQQPLSADVQALIGENALLTPMLAGSVGLALQNQGGTDNPAAGAAGLAAFVTALQSAQGGFSPADGGPGKGLFGAIREENYQPAPNPEQSSTGAPLIAFTFSNAAGNGWAPDATGWNAQQALPDLNSGKTVRLDPFLPTFLIWNARLNPLVFNDKQSQPASYDAANLTDYFQLGADAIDYQYKMNGSQAVPFTAPNSGSMRNSVVLSKKPTYSLSAQINNYVQNYPDDPAKTKLQAISAAYGQRKIMSQALSGFNLVQTLRNYIPQVPVYNLLSRPGQDEVTAQVHDAAATENDNWYDFGFNNMAAIDMGPDSFYNFGPLRSGFMSISYLEIVDVFGQRMQLLTQPAEPIQALAALPLQPDAADTANAGKIFLPPRLLPQTRLWFRWLSAAAGTGGDFVEMNTHPATTPVCGWVVPNHLDLSLMFYDADGKAIGSLGLSYGPQRYRTRPANIQANPSGDLSKDIGPPGNPTVNPNLANFIWYIYNQSADLQFLSDLRAAIESAGQFINPANHPQDAGLQVFIGRPLALTRAVLGLETSGNLLPLSQADVLKTDPFPSDVNNGRYAYEDRQKFSSGNLGAVQFPLRLGELTRTDDGLVAYLVESQGGYRNDTIYSPAASVPGGHKVEKPPFDNILLTLNAQPFTISLLVDPRAAVHATTGVLPVNSLRIPPDQYSAALQNLAMTFFTHPMLAPQQGLVTPLPREAGYDWSWIQPAGQAVQEFPQKANAVNEYATFGYTPQTLLEGWLQLKAAPKP